MAGNKLYITITDKRDGDGTTPTPSPESEGKKSNTVAEMGKYIEHEIFHMVKSQVTQGVNFAISNIGNLTGDYIAQRKVNEVKQAINGLVSVGMTTYAGAKAGFAIGNVYGGAIGAALGFVSGVGSQMTSKFYDVYSNNIENKKTNYDIAQLRERAGLNTVLDGSRGTEN